MLPIGQNAIKHSCHTINFLSKVDTVAFRFYHGCPVQCGHCALNESRHILRSRIGLSEVLAAIRVVIEANISKKILPTVCMGGSELIIGDEELIDAAAEITLGLGCAFGVTTSGYWAREGKLVEGIKYLHRCGVSFLQLSLDKLHGWDVESAVAFLRVLIKEGYGILLMETLVPGDKPIGDKICNLAGLNVKYWSCRTRSAVGRASIKRHEKADELFPYQDCDFGKVLYLDGDGQLYLCSGPGSRLSLRSIGRTTHNIVELYPDAHLMWLKSVVDVAKSSKRQLDECAWCVEFFRRTISPKHRVHWSAKSRRQ